MLINDPIAAIVIKLFYDGYKIQHHTFNSKSERAIKIDVGSQYDLLIVEIDYEMYVLYIDGDRENGFVFELHQLDNLPKNIEIYCKEYTNAMGIDYESNFKFKQ